MIAAIIILTITLILTVNALKAQRDRNTAQAHLIIELEKRVQLLQTADKLATERADTLHLGLKQAHSWLTLYREHTAQLEDENRMLSCACSVCAALGAGDRARVAQEGTIGDTDIPAHGCAAGGGTGEAGDRAELTTTV